MSEAAEIIEKTDALVKELLGKIDSSDHVHLILGGVTGALMGMYRHILSQSDETQQQIMKLGYQAGEALTEPKV